MSSIFKFANQRKRFVIIGGVAAGASAATRLRRLDESASITVLERGSFVSFASFGNVIKQRENLVVSTPQFFHDRFRIDVRLESTATAIDRNRKVVTYKTNAGAVTELEYDELLLATGASAIVPPIPGVQRDCVFALRSIPDADRLKQFIDSHQAKRACVVGGGFIGLEIAENLNRLGLETTILEKMSHILPPVDTEIAFPLQKYIESMNIKVITGDGIARIDDAAKGVDVVTEAQKRLPADIVILCIGVKPESDLAAAAGLELGIRRTIRTDGRMQTNDPHIFACGDVAQVKNGVTAADANVPLAGPAQRQGRIAAEAMLGGTREFNGAIGTAVLGFEQMCVARTGETEASLVGKPQKAAHIYVHPGNHASYFPGAQKIHLKLSYDPLNGRILGAQAVGAGEPVARRIDVVAGLIAKRGTVYDLAELELCYSPQFGSAKDPLNMAGMVAANAIDGISPLADWNEVLQITRAATPPTDVCLLDVRTKAEFDKHALPHAINIPLNDLREHVDQLRAYKRVLAYCGVGQRSHNAVRILRNLNFDAYNISGAYTTYQLFTQNALYKPLQ